MRLYRLKYSKAAQRDVDECYSYLAYYVGGTGDPRIAERFLENLEKTTDVIKLMPEGFALCDDLELRSKGIRKAHFFGRYNYKIFYHIVGETIIIDMVCHDLRNHQAILSIR